MEFQRDDILKLAQLSRIRLSEHDCEKFQSQLTSIVSYADQIMGIDVGTMREEVRGDGNLRNDIPYPSDAPADQLLAAAPRTEEGHIATHQVK